MAGFSIVKAHASFYSRVQEKPYPFLASLSSYLKVYLSQASLCAVLLFIVSSDLAVKLAVTRYFTSP